MVRGRSARWAVALGGTVAVLLLAAAGLGVGYAATRAAQGPRAAPSRSVPPVPGVVASATAAPNGATGSTASPGATGSTASPGATGSTASPGADTAAVAREVSGALSAPALGPQVRAEIVDARTGTVLYARGATAPAAPASTAKILTAAAALSVLGPTARFTTEVVRGPGSAVTLVGGGDPTLSCAAAGTAALYPGAGRMSDLAAALRRAHVAPTRVYVDDHAFAGPAVSPAWAPEDVPSDYASAITALVCDGGRDTPGAAVRSSTPDLGAARDLAALAGRPDVPVAEHPAPPGGQVLARVQSAPVSTLVTQMLQDSDNVIAEVLGRQVAIREKLSATFTGAAQAVRKVVTALGVDPGAGMKDASGLAASDRLTVSGLASVVQRLAAGAGPASEVLSALPVAGWSGTLVDRYRSASSGSAAGLVRAKTGTLTGVSSLAGVVHTADGGLYTFAIIADQTPATSPAEAALDAAAADLARCGCSR